MSSYGYHLIASSAAAVVARVCTHPLDTIKTRLQVANEPIHFRALPETYAKIIRTSSLASLYRGLPVALVFSVPALSIYLSCYDFSSLYLDKNTSISRDYTPNHLLSGLVAEVFAGLAFTPMEVLKNQLQTTRRSVSTNALALKIWREEGLSGFFRGYLMGLAVFVPYTMTYFAVYEKLKSYMADGTQQLPGKSSDTLVSQLPFMTYVACSSIACAIGITISTPLDIVKTRWQVSSTEEGTSYKRGPMHIIQDMWKQGGSRAFTRGLFTRICWGIPSTAISMTIYESIKDWYASEQIDNGN
ncbi:mitochondrial carrier domain-containing protein [Umbelopsis sp. AD052]|nr:mitochondrial carrier domain-containing protein [Umbelopsis sp. AD052]